MLVPTIFSLTWVCVPKKKEEAYIAEEGMAESIVLRTRQHPDRPFRKFRASEIRRSMNSIQFGNAGFKTGRGSVGIEHSWPHDIPCASTALLPASLSPHVDMQRLKKYMGMGKNKLSRALQKSPASQTAIGVRPNMQVSCNFVQRTFASVEFYFTCCHYRSILLHSKPID